jgi:hypothetical protein
MTKRDSKKTHPCSISLALQATVAALCMKSSRHYARLFGWKLWLAHLQSISSYHSLRSTVSALTGFIGFGAEDADIGRYDMLGKVRQPWRYPPFWKLHKLMGDGSSLPEVATSSSWLAVVFWDLPLRKLVLKRYSLRYGCTSYDRYELR